MQNGQAYKIIKKIQNSWPPLMARVQVTKSLDIWVTFLTSGGQKMGSSVVMTPLGENDYEIKSCSGFTPEQIQMFNEAPTYWYRLMRAYCSIVLTLKHNGKQI